MPGNLPVRFIRKIVSIFFILSSILLPGRAQLLYGVDTANDPFLPKTIDRDPDFVVVKGNLLRDMLGLKISKLRLYAFTGGSLTAIPFQIDECDPEGRLICPLGKKPGNDRDHGCFY